MSTAAVSSRMIEVAPNRFVPTRNTQGELPFTAPEIVLCDVVPDGDGRYKLVPRSWENLVRVSSDLCLSLGLGPATDTMRRLIRAGFVDGARIAPRVYNVNLGSFFRHMKVCAEDPDYWTRKRLQAFREAL